MNNTKKIAGTQNKRRTVCVVTGTRAEYGVLSSVLAAIKNHPKLELMLAVTGTHLEKQFGMTINEIRTDGYTVDCEIPIGPLTGDAPAVARSLGRAVTGFTEAFIKRRPDVVLVEGDRSETLAAVLAASFLSIPLAHLGGGDSAGGGLDEPTRHSITRFAQLHLVSTRAHAARLIRSGEEKKRVIVVGEPALDMTRAPLPSRKDVERSLGITLDQPTLVLIQHPVSTEPEKALEQIRETLAAIKTLGIHTICIAPNADAGSDLIRTELDAFTAPFFHVYTNISHMTYLALLKHASALVGNSSSGIIESASFHLPVVNIGKRQDGRDRAANVIDAPHKRVAIVTAVTKALSPAFRKRSSAVTNPYGDGRTAARVTTILATMPLTAETLTKRLTF